MKKVSLLASLAALLISGNAMALLAVPGAPLPIFLAGQPAGIATLAPFGPALLGVGVPALAPFGACNYHMRWSPNGVPMNALTCTLTEISTTNSAGCFLDAASNFATLVLAGPTSPVTFLLPPTVCSGFDQFGISHLATVDLLLAETVIPPGPPPVPGVPSIPDLVGLATFLDFVPMPQSITIG